MKCPHCDSNDLHGPSNDFYGVICVECGATIMMDRSSKPDRQTIAEIILRSIYDSDQDYMEVALNCADDIIAGLNAGVSDEVSD
jgi:hypothetical protein